MARKSRSTPPSWAYEDNPKSNFGRIYPDMLKSNAFRSLSGSAQRFYIVCLANSWDEKGQECLYNHLKERNDVWEVPKPDFDLRRMAHSGDYFVMPKAHYESYGFTKGHAGRCFQELISAGFIEKVECNKRCWKVNVYQFSAKWKNKIRSSHREHKSD